MLSSVKGAGPEGDLDPESERHRLISPELMFTSKLSVLERMRLLPFRFTGVAHPIHQGA